MQLRRRSRTSRHQRQQLLRGVAQLMEAGLGESPREAALLADRWLERSRLVANRWQETAAMSPDQVQQRVAPLISEDLLRLCAFCSKREQGIVLATPHMGDYMAALFAIFQHLPGRRVVILRRKSEEALELKVFQKLAESGIEFEVLRTAAKRSALQLYRHLRSGGIAAMLYDLPARYGTTTPLQFLQSTVHWVSGPVLMAARSGSLVIPFVAYADGRPCCDFQPVICCADRSGAASAALDTAQQLASMAESYIRRYPDQWMHWHLLPEMLDGSALGV